MGVTSGNGNTYVCHRGHLTSEGHPSSVSGPIHYSNSHMPVNNWSDICHCASVAVSTLTVKVMDRCMPIQENNAFRDRECTRNANGALCVLQALSSGVKLEHIDSLTFI